MNEREREERGTKKLRETVEPTGQGSAWVEMPGLYREKPGGREA